MKKKNIEILWMVIDSLFRIFVYAFIMDSIMNDNSFNIIWKTIAYCAGLIFILAPLRKLILE